MHANVPSSLRTGPQIAPAYILPSDCSRVYFAMVTFNHLPHPVLLAVLVILSLIISIAFVEATATKPNQQPSHFLHNLAGRRKGETAKGVNQLKQYLHFLGYVIYPNSTVSLTSSNGDAGNDDEFDSTLESAIKTYQMNYRLNVTGELDAETVQQLMKPRCGVADIFNRTNFLAPGKKHRSRPMGLHGFLNYEFVPGSPRWPQTHLTYMFLNSAQQLRPTTSQAFRTWAEVTQFSFQEVMDIDSADITIGAFSGDHGDGNSFDGPGGTLAHATPPTDGRFHLDADEAWSTNPGPYQMDLESVTLHEIGHLLGLAHTPDSDAVMYAYMTRGNVKRDLRNDDINGIRALYNL